MIRACTIIAALMATPAMADFKQITIPAYCSSVFTDFEDTFGEFESVEFGDTPNRKGAASVFMENERYTLTGFAHISGVVCITWALDRGEAG